MSAIQFETRASVITTMRTDEKNFSLRFLVPRSTRGVMFATDAATKATATTQASATSTTSVSITPTSAPTAVLPSQALADVKATRLMTEAATAFMNERSIPRSESQTRASDAHHVPGLALQSFTPSATKRPPRMRYFSELTTVEECDARDVPLLRPWPRPPSCSCAVLNPAASSGQHRTITSHSPLTCLSATELDQGHTHAHPYRRTPAPYSDPLVVRKARGAFVSAESIPITQSPAGSTPGIRAPP